MQQDFEAARKLLREANNILLTTHERTDGDDFGSISALAFHLQNRGKVVTRVVKGGVPENLKFLPKSSEAFGEFKNNQYDLLVISGCSVKKRVGEDQIINLKIPTINIDHHPDNTKHGDVNVVDETKSSVAELVYDLFKHCAWEITPEIATCLLTGIFTDTGSFMHSNTQSSTLKAAADLMKKGGRLDKIAKSTYSGKSLQTLKAWGKAIENTFYDAKKQIIFSVMTDKDLEEMEKISGSTFEGFVETLNKVPEAKFAMFLKQDGDVIKGSLRSDPHKGINVGEIARMLGGGGHMWASGFSVVGHLEKDNQGKWQVIKNQN